MRDVGEAESFFPDDLPMLRDGNRVTVSTGVCRIGTQTIKSSRPVTFTITPPGATDVKNEQCVLADDRPNQWMGGTHVIIKKFDPLAFFDLVNRERVTFACMPPTMINMALNHSLSDEELKRLPQGVRVGTAGSAPPLASIQGMQERFGWRVIQIYGLTETAPFLTVSKVKPTMDDWPEDDKLRVQAKTGYPMIGVDVRVVDDQGRSALARFAVQDLAIGRTV